MRLYSFFRSSAAYRVRIALNLKAVDYEIVTVRFARREHKSPEFLALNPQGLLPVLDDDGVVLTQSLAIIEYLDTRFPTPRLLPDEPVARARVAALAQLVAAEIHPLNNLRVLRYLREQLDLEESAVKQWYGHWVSESFAALEAQVAKLSSTGEYCYGTSVSMADVCLVPQVYNARRFDCDLEPYPRLTAIADALAETDAFARAAPERQPDAK